MALVACPECGKNVSHEAIACTNCGVPIAGRVKLRPIPPPKTWKEIQTIILRMFLVFFGLIVLMFVIGFIRNLL